MRRMGGPWTSGTAGAATPRPCVRLPLVAALIAIAHAGAIGWAWQREPAKPAAAPQQRMAVRLVAARAPQMATAAQAPSPTRSSKPAAAPKLPVKRKTEPAEKKKPPVAVAQTPATPPITGVAFAPPRIAIGAMSRARWMPPSPPVAAAMPPVPPLRWAPGHAARDAGRQQIVDALQRQLAGAALPAEAIAGVCVLPDPAGALLACDSDAVHTALAPHEPRLAALLAAYRRIDATGLAIEVRDGRYRVAPPPDTVIADQRASGASATSTPREVTVTPPGL